MLLGDTIGVLKISDFGLAKPDATTTEKNTCFMGTIVYMAPEVINDQGVNSAADVYSLGISTWEMFHRKKPFYEHNSLSLFTLGNRIITGTRPKIELKMEEEMKNLILRSLEAQYTLRPKARDFTTIAIKLRSETSVSPKAPKAQKAAYTYNPPEKMDRQFADPLVSVTPPIRPLSSKIQNSFDSELTLLIGGFRDKNRAPKTLLAFEHNTETWKDLDVGIPNFVGGALVLDEELYVFGEEKLVEGLFKLNPEKRSWIKLTNIPKARNPSSLKSVAYRSKIYVVQGYGICKSAFAYDPRAHSWSELAPINETMRIEGITVLHNKLYIFGGGVDCPMKAGYYDTVEDKWTYLSLDVPIPFTYTQAVTYKNELVFFYEHNAYALNLAERTPLKTLPQLNTWRKYAAVFTCGNSLFVAGGHRGKGRCTIRVESFDGTTWTEMPRMPYGFTAFTTVTVTGDLAKQLLKWSC